MSTLRTFTAYLKYKGSTTKFEATMNIKETNTGDKIMKMRAQGYDIETVMIPRPNRQPYAKYVLRGDVS